MKFPTRSETHKIEAQSWKLLLNIAPDNWIVREVSERDYGVDAYIEICTVDNQVTGNLISIQLKGTSELSWGENCQTKSPSIKTSTAQYWHNLPVPVFLFVADISAKEIYYCSVEDSIRNQYAKLKEQSSISFTLHSELKLSNETGLEVLGFLINRERMHQYFVFHISNLLSNVNNFVDFIEENQSRDFHMEIESGRHLRFRNLYESCKAASINIKLEWHIESLADLYEMDKKNFPDGSTDLHEHTLDYALKKIESIFPSLINDAVTLVTEKQASYWEEKDPVFLSLCEDEDTRYRIKELESNQ